MTGKELLEKYAIKKRMSDALDTGYTDEELLAYINDSISFIWHVLIANRFPEVIGDLEITQEEMDLPDDWYTPTNMAPVLVVNNKQEDGSYKQTLKCYGELPYELRYFKTPHLLESLDDTVPKTYPFTNPVLTNIMAQMVVQMAMVNHGFQMADEYDFTNAIIKLLPIGH